MKYKLLLVAFVLFTTNMLFSQSVVLNKYQNSGSTADIIELLVVQDNLDMRGMVLKTFSSNNTLDSGGSMTFNNVVFWSSMRAGTLIVITNIAGTSLDLITSCGDFSLNMYAKGDAGAYFTNAGTFDIASTDMCMIKTGATSGVTGNIHTLRTGTATAQWTSVPGIKIGNTTPASSGNYAVVNNATPAIGDYALGTTGVTVGSPYTFGSGNNATNTNFINFLRGPVSAAATVITQVSFSANWAAVTGATSYRLDVSTLSDFSTFVSGYQDLNVGNVVTYPVAGLTAGTQYYYRVRAVNATPTISGNSCTQSPITLLPITSKQNGDWYDTNTWTGLAVPTSTQYVVIKHAVTNATTLPANITRGVNVSTTIDVGASLSTGAYQYSSNSPTNVNGTFQIETGGWANGTNFTYGSAGTLNFNKSGSAYTVNNTDVFWPTTSGPINVNVLQGGLIMNSATRTVSGIFTTAAAVTLTTCTLTFTGTCQLNAGGSFANTPIYGGASTLIYNASYTVSNEWTGNSTTAGTGIPQNVTIQNLAVVNIPNSSSARGMAGSLTITSGSLTLGGTAGDDLYVAGNWTRASTAAFNPNNRAVYFNAPTAVDQLITITASGTATFSFLQVQGSGTLKLAAGTNVVVNAASGLTLGSSNATSTIDLNGQSLTLLGGGNLDLGAGARKITNSNVTAANIIITTADLTVTNGGSLSTATNILINLQRGLDCGTGSLLTINGTLQINSNGFSTGNSPRYGNASLLQYNTLSTTYNRQLEWTSFTAAIGTPNNVQISNNCTLNYYNVSNTGPKNITGNLVVDLGSTFSMGSSDTLGAVTVPGDVTVAGTLSLCIVYNVLGNDLKMGGNLAFTGTGSLVGNNRAIFFTKNGIQQVSSVAALTIPYVVTAGSTATTVQLLSNLIISSSSLGGNAIVFGNGADVIDLNGFTLTIGSTGNAGAISGTGSFKGSTTSNLTLLGTGNIGTSKFGPLAADMNLATLTMNRTSSGWCTMGSNLTINAASATALTLTAGIIDLGAFTMTIASGTALSGVTSGSATSYVIADKTALGVFSVAVTGTAIAYKFPIGDRAASNNGSEYSPATMTFTLGTFTTAFLGMAVENSKEPDLDATANYINRYWEVIPSGTFNSPTYNFVGTYINAIFPAGDVTGTNTSSRANHWIDGLWANGSLWSNSGGAASVITGPPSTITLPATITTLAAKNHYTAGRRDQEINIRVTPSTNYLTTSTYDFGTVAIGSTGTVSFQVQNLGQLTLTLGAGTLTGGNYSTNYTAQNAAPIPGPTINPLSNVSNYFTVVFTPTTPGTITGSISIVNDDPSPSNGENPYVINFTGEAICNPVPINTISPASGPVGTEVTITATNASDFTGGATVTFLGTAATSTTTTGTTIINAIVPSAVINGSGTVTTVNANGCIASNSFTVDKNLTNTCLGGTNLSDLFISEVTDATYGGLTYVEIYNGTGADVNLASYSLQFFANGSGSSYGTQVLSGTIVKNTTYTVRTALSGYSCTVTGGDGSKADFATGIAGINFDVNGNDHIALYKAALKIDSWGVAGNANWSTSPTNLNIGDRGVDFRRKNNVGVPNPTFDPSQWDIINWSGTGTSSCSNNDYSNIGVFNFLGGPPPTFTTSPTYSPTCKTATLAVTGAAEGYADAIGINYQWYAVAPGAPTWSPIANGSLYSGVTTATLNLLNTSTLIGYQFYCQINENTSTCHTSTNAVKIVAGTTLTWNGSSWTGGPPTSPSLTTAVVFNGNYDMTTPLPSFEACSVTVNSPYVLTITSGNYVAIQNDLTVNTALGGVVVQDDGSLVQIDDNGVNTGSVDVKRTATVKLQDYVYWSSPVASFPVASVSPGTSSSLMWKWDPITNNSNNGQGLWQNAAADNMSVGKGYIIKGLAGTNAVAADYTATFRGTPFNGLQQPAISRGTITATVNPFSVTLPPYTGTNGATITQFSDNMNLMGNPYPSSINALDFINGNANILGSIRLWVHGIAPSTSPTNPFYGSYTNNYSPLDYITYNSSGASCGVCFNGYIASGQGFFVTMVDGSTVSQTVTFNNAMRRNGSTYYNNSNFFRNANNHTTSVSQEIERNRIWIDLISSTGIGNRMLVGYIQGATMEEDRVFDAITSVSNFQNFYSLINDKVFSIQGRALPFNHDDTVALGVNLLTSGSYTIAIATTDGLFENASQDIFLEDTVLNVIHDLRQAPYVFTAESGRFDTRFVLRYKNPSALGTDDFETLANSVVVATPSHNQISIKSYVEIMKDVEVYDMLGRVVYTNKEVNLKDLVISNVMSQQALIVKITLENELVVTKKIVVK